jgi:rubrerythrin
MYEMSERWYDVFMDGSKAKGYNRLKVQCRHIAWTEDIFQQDQLEITHKLRERGVVGVFMFKRRSTLTEALETSRVIR